MLLQPESCALLLVDYQERLRPAIADHEAVWQKAEQLAQTAKWLDVPVFASEHVPEKLGATTADIAQHIAPHRVFDKHHFSAANAEADISALVLLDEYQEELESKAAASKNSPQGNARSLPKHLRKKPVQAAALETVVVAGCETHICLMQTVLELINNEWDVAVVVDACGSRKSVDKDAALDRIAAAGAELVTVEMLAFEWLGSSTHQQFKAVQGLFK